MSDWNINYEGMKFVDLREFQEEFIKYMDKIIRELDWKLVLEGKKCV